MNNVQEIQENNDQVLKLLMETGLINIRYIKQLIQANQYLLSHYNPIHPQNSISTPDIATNDTDLVQMEEGYQPLTKPKLRRCVRTIHKASLAQC